MTRQATAADFYTGSELLNPVCGTECFVKDQTDEETYTVEIWKGSRLVGTKAEFTSNAKFYQVAL